MAFLPSGFVSDSGANSSASAIFRYRNGGDTLAAIKAANYFDPAAAESGGYGLRTNDVILAQGSDGISFLQITVTAGVATTASANDFA